nr:pterin-4-alpha-carbinolamine dehydratase 2, mitochondrial isoform X2 [Nicotiana tomentosiformis]
MDFQVYPKDYNNKINTTRKYVQFGSAHSHIEVNLPEPKRPLFSADVSMIRTLQARLAILSNASVSLASLSQSFSRNHGSSNIRVAGTGVVCSQVAVSANTNTHNGIKTLCSAADLSTKKCVPCNAKDLRPMSEEAANQLMWQVTGWDLLNDGGTLKLHRSWKVKTFSKGLEFFQEVANVAEAEGHHPDLHLVGWNNVIIDIWTHSVGGLTENDFILAAKINGLDVQHLLSKKTAKSAQSSA